jgi:hypothetical protein
MRRPIYNLRLPSGNIVQVCICCRIEKGKSKGQVVVETPDATRLVSVDETSLQPTDNYEK